MNKQTAIELNPNKLVQYLNKPAADFTKQDIVKYIVDQNIKMINFRYVGGDGRLKTLNFIITSRRQIDEILSHGERIDGSSLFSYIDAASSDLYVVPRFRTAYFNPFAEIPTVDILCSYYTNTGEALSNAPDTVIRKAHEVFTQETGCTFEAMGELEYYIIGPPRDLYPIQTQRGYHESVPFSRYEMLRCEAMNAIAQAGGKIKYGHSEVGTLADDEKEMEQHEIEFLPVPMEEAADQIVLAKWMLRMVGRKYGVNISFSPKVIAGHAGSGLHIHTRLVKDGRNMMIQGNQLSDTAKKAIAGYLKLSPSLTAFGNTVPISYLRLVPHQEAPTRICWGDRNRSVLVRVPLGWLSGGEMLRDANPAESGDLAKIPEYQTVEFRCPDGSANIHLLLAGLATAARYGLTMQDSLAFAEKHYAQGNIFSGSADTGQNSFPDLPKSCWESANALEDQRDYYTDKDVFPAGIIDKTIHMLRDYHDQELSEKLYGKVDDVRKLVDTYINSF